MRRFVPWALVVASVAGVSSRASAAPTPPNSLENDLERVNACSCHDFENRPELRDQPSYAPIAWKGSLMSNAARDPVFWAGIAVASQDQETPDETELCVRCHAPRATLEGRGGAIAITELLPPDLDGIECDACHRMVDDGITPAGNAQYTIDDELVNGGVPKRGPFEYPGIKPPHATIQDDLIGSSRFCGTCHDVTTHKQRVDDNGDEVGIEFNEQRTYSEWVNSALAMPGPEFRSCQDCHLPEVNDVGGCLDFDNGDQTHPAGVRRHDFVGANRSVVELLKQTLGSAGTGEIDDAAFDYTLARMDEILATAATVEIEAPPSVDLQEGLRDLSVTVTNNTGHKLPSGYSEGRVMWIEVVGSYGDLELFTSGQYLLGEGPTRDDQVRTYEGIAEDHVTGQRLHLLLNDRWVVDNRIPPRGLRPDIQTDPVGDRYTLQTDGTWPNWDVATYAFDPIPDVDDLTPDDDTDDRLELRVRLLYLINTAEYLDVLRDDNMTNAAGANLRASFDLIGGPEPVVLSDESLELPLIGLRRPGDTGTTGGSTGPTDTSHGSTSDDPTTGGPGGPTTGNGTTDGADTDGGDNPDDGEGCDCAAGASTPAAMAWLLLLGPAWRRGRRRLD